MDQVEQFKGNIGVNYPNPSVSNSENKTKQIGLEEKKAAVNEELKRMDKLPPNSVYVIHRARVLNKIMQLLSLQRTTSQDEELELLFAGLSL